MMPLRAHVGVLALLLASMAGVSEVRAQDIEPRPGAAQTEVDTSFAFYRDMRGREIEGVPPERSTALHPIEWLSDVPGTFSYSFRMAGWPSTWSPYGIAPDDVRLYRDGIPYENLTVGRAALEMLPIGLMDPLRMTSAGIAPALLAANTRTFDQPRPLTGLRYQTDNLALQHVEAFHSQRRLASLFGRRGILNISGAYLGRGASGEYPGSRIRRERGIYGRVRFARPNWSLQISDLYGRHDVGAHGGVVPWTGGPYETIFVRTDAVVRSNGARRVTIRNTLDATFRHSLLGDTLTAIGYRTSESFRYRFGNDFTATRIHRNGFRLMQPLPAGIHRFEVAAEGWIESVENDSAFTVRGDLQRREATVMLRDRVRLGFFDASLEMGMRSTETGTAPVGAANVSVGPPDTRIWAEASSSAVSPSRVAQQGFGGFVVPLESPRLGRTSVAAAGVDWQRGSLLVDARTFFVREEDRTEYVAFPGRDSVSAVVYGSPADRAGVAVRMGLRASAQRGLYLDGVANYLAWVQEPDLPGAALLSETQPALHGHVRAGARVLLFRGDLDADFYIRGRAWSGMRSRVLHPQTGLLVVPESSSRWFNPSGVVDLVMEGLVRTATVFINFENVLSGTTITPGNLIIPDYPLPERRLRFGVYWPIED